MSDFFVGQIMLFANSYAPKGWALCAGQKLPISQNTALYSLLGTNFGGDGIRDFALPNLQGIVVTGSDTGQPVGSTNGATTVTLTLPMLAAHNHLFVATTNKGGTGTAGNNIMAAAGQIDRGGGQKTGVGCYSDSPTNTALAPQSVALAGGNGAHNNMQPYLVLNYCICLVGVYPPRP